MTSTETDHSSRAVLDAPDQSLTTAPLFVGVTPSADPGIEGDIIPTPYDASLKGLYCQLHKVLGGLEGFHFSVEPVWPNDPTHQGLAPALGLFGYGDNHPVADTLHELMRNFLPELREGKLLYHVQRLNRIPVVVPWSDYEHPEIKKILKINKGSSKGEE